MLSQDATRTPHGDGNLPSPTTLEDPISRMQPAPLTGTETFLAGILISSIVSMQPAPLTGTATFTVLTRLVLLRDATRTPRGDGNLTLRSHASAKHRMQPAPLTGTATHSILHSKVRTHQRCNPHPSRGQINSAHHFVMCGVFLCSLHLMGAFAALRFRLPGDREHNTHLHQLEKQRRTAIAEKRQ